MLADLAERHALIQECFDEASAGAGVDLWALSQQGPEAQLNQTEFTQPALLAAGVAVWRLWLAQGGARPEVIAGHSLGEYAARVAADAISLHDAAKLVRERGRLMQAAVPEGTGGMAAVLGADDDLVTQICASVSASGIVVPANFNSPGQIVIGGEITAVDAAIAALNEAGIRKVIKLAVSVPSHTPLMKDAALELGRFMQSLSWNAPKLKVVHNVDAQVRGDVASIQQALVRQLSEPVQWTACVQTLAAAGCQRIAECGPGKVLAGLSKRIDKSLESKPLGTLSDFESVLSEWGTV